MPSSLSATGGLPMHAHRHSAMERDQGKSRAPQRRPMPTGRAAGTRQVRGCRRWGWSRGVALLGLIGLLGLLGWGTAPPQGQDLLQPPSPSPRVLEPARHVTRLESYGHLPLSFEANQGQTDDQVQFLAHGQGYTLFLTAHEAVFAFRPPAAPGPQPKGIAPRTGMGSDTLDTARTVVH